MAESQKYKKVLLSDIKADPNNPRYHTPANLAAIRGSLVDYGQYRPIVVNSNTNTIIAGHGMFQVMMSLGWKEAECIFLDVTHEQAAKMTITDNRTAELAEWDMPKLCRQLQSADSIEGFGFIESDLADMMKRVGVEPKEEKTDDLDKKTICCPKCSHQFSRKKKRGSKKNTSGQAET